MNKRKLSLGKGKGEKGGIRDLGRTVGVREEASRMCWKEGMNGLFKP